MKRDDTSVNSELVFTSMVIGFLSIIFVEDKFFGAVILSAEISDLFSF